MRTRKDPSGERAMSATPSRTGGVPYIGKARYLSLAHGTPAGGRTGVRWGLWVLAALAVALLLGRGTGGAGGVRTSAPAVGAIPAEAVVADTPAPSTEPPVAATNTHTPAEFRPLAGADPADLPKTAVEPEKAAQTIEQTTQLTLEPSDNGNYYVKGAINGQEVLFLLDTGASWISIPERLRWRLALERGRYVRVATAAGVVGNYATQVDTLDVGPFHFLDVAAALNPYAPNDVVLLGMSALKDIQFTQSRGQLVLSQQTPTESPMLPAAPARDAPPLVMRRSVRDCMGPGGLLDADSLKCIEGR